MEEFAQDAFVHVVPSKAAEGLLTVLRDKNTDGHKFCIYADRVCHLLIEEGIAQDHLANSDVVHTPCGDMTGRWLPDTDTVSFVSIVRSGDILLQAAQRLLPGVGAGKILIQRDERDPEKRPKLFYRKLPKNIATTKVMLVDPMLATGGSVKMAISVLLENGVKEENITFLNIISCPEGIRALRKAYPLIHLVTLAVDTKLNEEKFITPGLGDFGDRYFQTP